jgi:hypothetical protein
MVDHSWRIFWCSRRRWGGTLGWGWAGSIWWIDW